MSAIDRIQQWKASRGPGPWRILALAGLLLFAGVVAVVLVAYALQPAQPEAPTGTAVPAAQRLQQLLAQQLQVEPASIQIVEVKEETWPDACLGAPYSDQLCAQVQTPGYRVRLAVDGSEYLYHTDLDGTQFRLVLSPTPLIGERIVTWFGSDNESCQALEVGTGGTAFGRCGRPLLGVPYPVGARAAGLAEMSVTYGAFEAETAAGTVQFAGLGSAVATSAEQRMIAEWARLVYQEAERGRSSASPGLVLAWHREGGLAGFCDEVALYVTGDAYASSCQGDRAEGIGHVRLDAGQLATLYDWVDTLGPFEYEDVDPATADAMTVRVAFSGTGRQVVQAVDRQLMMDLAQSLHNQAMMLVGDTPSVCPRPGAGQQLLLDRGAGYCLIYPAEHTLVQTGDGVTELVAGSVLNHVQPRVSIAVEEAAERSLDEVVAQLETDYVPAGWEVLRRSIVVDGVEGVELDNLPGQDLNRRVAFLHDGRLYTLFLTPLGDEGSETREQAETLYRQMLDSFRFVDLDAPTPRPATNADDLVPIQFAPGNTSATVSGTVSALVPQRYVLRGLGGQTLSVELETDGLETYLTVLTPKGENMAGADGPIHQWSGRLPVDGDYVIEVVNPEDGVVDFSLTASLSTTAVDPGAGEPVEVLIQLDWEGGFTPREFAVPFGRVPAFTLLADGRVLYVDPGHRLEPNQEQLLIAQLRSDETQALLQKVLDLGFERLESHLDWCQVLADGSSECVADAGYSILRVRLADGELREIRNWHEFANDPEALLAIRSLLSDYRHPQAAQYLPDRASLFVSSIPEAEGLAVADWPLNPGWLMPPAPAVEQWAGVLAEEEWAALMMVTSRNMGIHTFREGDRFYQVVVVPWLPGTDYTDDTVTYRWP